MVFRPEVFLSATPVELDPFREVARKALREMGANVVEQLDYTVAYGPLQGLLYQAIKPCEVVIHLAGRGYGVEPADRTLGDPRRSFAQYEVDVAKSSGKTVFSFLTTPETYTAAIPPEDDERLGLQREHRAALERSGDLVQTFRDGEELATKIRALRPRIMVRRSFVRLPRAPLGAGFVGRQQLMSTIGDQLKAGEVVVLHAPPERAVESGTGRTTLAIEVAWRLHEEGRFPFVFTVPGGARVDLEVSLAALARSDALGLVPDEVAGHNARLRAVTQWLARDENRGRWLLLVDGVDEEVNWLRVRRFLDQIGSGSVLVTSRIPSWPQARSYSLGAWGVEQAQNYVLSRTAHGMSQTRNDLAAADRLANGLGRLPLALEIATAKIQHDRASAADLLTQHEARTRSIRAASDLTVEGPTLFELVGDVVAGLDDFTRALLQQFACLAPQPASISMSLYEGRGDTEIVKASISVLQRLALITRDDNGRSLSMHRLIRKIIRQQMRSGDYGSALGAALSTLEMAFRREGAGSVVLREALVSHSRLVIAQIAEHPLEVHGAGLVSSFAHWLLEMGRFGEAEPFFRRALSIHEKRFGKEHPEVAGALRDLANVLRLRGKSAEAEPLLHRALKISESIFGKDSPDLVGDLYLLGSCQRALHQLAPAEELLRRALLIEERHSGRSHPRFAVALHRLASLLEAQARYVEAEALYRRAITIDEEKVGPNHPRVIAGLYNLSGVLAISRRGDEAEQLLRRALAHDEKTYGPNHLEVTPALRLLAEVLDRRDARAEAEQLWRRIVSSDEATFGSDLPELAADRLALAALLYRDARPVEARPFAEQGIRSLVAIGKKAGRPHPYLELALSLYREILAESGMEADAIAKEIETLLGGRQPRRVHARI
jgi:tetratricopeptide (TPR) repeat protein